MRKVITASIGLLLILFYCASCGPGYHLRRAEHHIKRAELKGAKWHRDTLWKDLKFKVPGINVKFTPQILTSGKPMIFVKDSVRTEVLIKRGKNGVDTVYVDTKCPDRIVTKKIPVAVSNDIKAGRSFWTDILIWVFIALVAFTLGYWARDGPKFFAIRFDKNEKPSG